jgi:hypothetical protein
VTGHDLLGDEILDLSGVEVVFSATERLTIRQPGMRADAQAVLLRDRGRSANQVRASGMTATSDTDGGDERHQCGVEGQSFGTVALPHVAVQVKPS